MKILRGFCNGLQKLPAFGREFACLKRALHFAGNLTKWFSMDLLLPRQRIVKVHEVGAHRLLAHDGLHVEVDLTAHVAL